MVFNNAFVRAIVVDSLGDLLTPPHIMAYTDPNCGCGMRATGVSNAVRLSLQLEETNENLKPLTKQSKEQQAATEEHMTTILTAQAELVAKIQEKIPRAVFESLLSQFEHEDWKGKTHCAGRVEQPAGIYCDHSVTKRAGRNECWNSGQPGQCSGLG